MNLDGKPIRKEVLVFAALMERMLRRHDAEKGEQGWKDDAPKELLKRVMQEASEFYRVTAPINAEDRQAFNPTEISDEAIDVANMLMMFLDSLSLLPPADLEVLDDTPPAVNKPIDWADLAPEQYVFAREISDVTGIRPLILGNGIPPTRRGQFRLVTGFMAGKTRMDWEIEGPELVVLLRQSIARVRVDHRPE